MSVGFALWAFTAAAALATVAPGLDTALVLRTSAVVGRRGGMMAGLGICVGVMVWGSAAALGLAQLLAASAVAYDVVRIVGAGYLVYLGAGMLLRPRTTFATGSDARDPGDGSAHAVMASFRRGLLTNLLNPKVGVFYVSFLPQFIPPDAASPRALMLVMAAIHSVEGLLWFALLSAATHRLVPVLRRGRVIKRLDQAMGTVFVAFGLRLALERRA